MRKVSLALFVVLVLTSLALTVNYSPQKVESIRVRVEPGLWRERITNGILVLIKPGMKLDDTDRLKSEIASLPWVKSCSLKFVRGKLSIDVESEPVKLAIFSNGYYNIIGKNGYILDRQRRKPKKLKILFYKGKAPFFYRRGDFLKVKNEVLLQSDLIMNKLERENPIGEKPEVVLTDRGLKLIYLKRRIVVLLGNGGNSWKNFVELFKMIHMPASNIYDFRFSGLLFIKGRNGNG